MPKILGTEKGKIEGSVVALSQNALCSTVSRKFCNNFYSQISSLYIPENPQRECGYGYFESVKKIPDCLVELMNFTT